MICAIKYCHQHHVPEPDQNQPDSVSIRQIILGHAQYSMTILTNRSHINTPRPEASSKKKPHKMISQFLSQDHSQNDHNFHQQKFCSAWKITLSDKIILALSFPQITEERGMTASALREQLEAFRHKVVFIHEDKFLLRKFNPCRVYCGSSIILLPSSITNWYVIVPKNIIHNGLQDIRSSTPQS